MYHVGTLHEKGLGVQKSQPAAVKWYKKVCESWLQKSESTAQEARGVNI